ncbi:MAG: hypothetical protein ACNA8W_01000 [Bradymonadaceae bacterium]
MHLTPKMVIQFWQDMMTRFQTRTCLKTDSLRMRATAQMLGMIRLMDAPTFMERYTTVWGHTIYTPFVIGQGSDQDTLWWQIVVCVHEHQHVVQFDRDGFLPYGVRYVLSSRRRAILEAEAYLCNIELHYRRHRELPDLDALAARLGPYGCCPEDVARARAIFEEAAPRIAAGEIVTEAGRAAIDLLEKLSNDSLP